MARAWRKVVLKNVAAEALSHVALVTGSRAVPIPVLKNLAAVAKANFGWEVLALAVMG